MSSSAQSSSRFSALLSPSLTSPSLRSLSSSSLNLSSPPPPSTSPPLSTTSTTTIMPGGEKRTSSIYERNVIKSRGSEVSLGAWAFLFSEIVQYTQRRVSSVGEFEKRFVLPSLPLPSPSFLLSFSPFPEKILIETIDDDDRLNVLGYNIGTRLHELLPLRDQVYPTTSSLRAPPPPTRLLRLLPLLSYLHSPLYRYLFSKPADSLEKSTEMEDEYMIGDNDMMITKGVEVPKEMSELSCGALVAGIMEAILDGAGFVSFLFLFFFFLPSHSLSVALSGKVLTFSRVVEFG